MPGERWVLVVEDNAELAELLARSLTALQPWKVQAAHSAEAALEWLRSAPMDAAVVDLGLPGMDGYQLCVRMRTFFRGPILIVSVENREHFKLRALACGADAYCRHLRWGEPSPLDLAAPVSGIFGHGPGQTAARALQPLESSSPRSGHGVCRARAKCPVA